ncbi:hypothetical protein BBO01nite_43950 [Brevibacillus borstelensis]|nr:hypothetical protein BBO01nite_43950 [Brevibacillus borstelensis]
MALRLAITPYLWYAYATVLDGEVAVPCNLQSAIAGLNSYQRSSHVRLPYDGGVEERVLCNVNP